MTAIIIRSLKCGGMVVNNGDEVTITYRQNSPFIKSVTGVISCIDVDGTVTIDYSEKFKSQVICLTPCDIVSVSLPVSMPDLAPVDKERC